jgi:uncharacterized membrane protein
MAEDTIQVLLHEVGLLAQFVAMWYFIVKWEWQNWKDGKENQAMWEEIKTRYDRGKLT